MRAISLLTLLMIEALLVVGRPALAQQSETAPKPNFFWEGVALGLYRSFIDFDLCGEGELGESYRKIYFDAVKQCPIPDDQQKAASVSMLREIENLRTNFRRYLAHDGAEKVELAEKACKEHHDIGAYDKIGEMLERYNRGELTLGDLMPGDCGIEPQKP